MTCYNVVMSKRPPAAKGIPILVADSSILQRAFKSWGLVLTGQQHDLRDCKNALPQGGDPWIEVIEVDVVLRSAAFDGLSLPQALRYGKQLLRLINGAMLARGAPTALEFQSLLEFVKGRRTPSRHTFPRFDWKNLDDIRRVNADPLSRSKPPSQIQKWLAKAVETSELADALMLLGGQFDWFELYKVLECLEASYGGEHQLRQQRWVPRSYKKLKQSANWPRHWRRSGDELTEALSLKSARAQTVKLLRTALEDRTKGSRIARSNNTSDDTLTSKERAKNRSGGE
jgi:hypothetical protein